MSDSAINELTTQMGKLTVNEEWKDVKIPNHPEFSGKYLVSNMGKVYSKFKKTVMSPCQRSGYDSVHLSDVSGGKNLKNHRLVAMAFIPKPVGCDIVNHIDGNRHNNCVTNLEWTTIADNNKHSREVLGSKRSGVKVQQFTMSGEYIATYDSVREAGIKTKISDKHISSVCRGKRGSTGGFIWKYPTDIREEEPEGKEFPGYPGYIVTRDGRIYSKMLNQFMVTKEVGGGYVGLGLCAGGVKKDFYVHILVATLYIENPFCKSQVNHKDRNTTNNRVDNLEWVTASENMQHVVKTDAEAKARAASISSTPVFMRLNIMPSTQNSTAPLKQQ